MQNLSDILPLFCAPTWPSNHVSENQEYVWADLFIHLKKNLLDFDRKYLVSLFVEANSLEIA